MLGNKGQEIAVVSALQAPHFTSSISKAAPAIRTTRAIGLFSFGEVVSGESS